MWLPTTPPVSAISGTRSPEQALSPDANTDRELTAYLKDAASIHAGEAALDSFVQLSAPIRLLCAKRRKGMPMNTQSNIVSEGTVD